jgi:hypothetical protein
MQRWGVSEAWEAAALATATVYCVEPALIRAESRGRGPRPPQSIWEAKKMAVHIAVTVSGCDYAALGRALGMHRDTIASHCAEMRQRAAEDEFLETTSQLLEQATRAQLERRALTVLDAARAHLAMLEDAARDLVSVMPQRPSTDRHPTLHPTEVRPHETVIELRSKRRIAR